MDRRLNMLLLTVGLILMISSCGAAPVSEELDLLTQLLRKANTVLDNVIAKQRVERTKQDVALELDQRNEDGSRPEFDTALHYNGQDTLKRDARQDGSRPEFDTALHYNGQDTLKRDARWGADFLILICKELQLHGLYDPSCETIGDIDRPTAERSYKDVTKKSKDVERKARSHVSVISEICEVFRRHGIVVDECRLLEEEIPAAERSVRDHDGMAYVERPERTAEDADHEQSKEVSEPEPSPVNDDSDISLSRVLKYLQRLRNIRKHTD